MWTREHVGVNVRCASRATHNMRCPRRCVARTTHNMRCPRRCGARTTHNMRCPRRCVARTTQNMRQQRAGMISRMCWFEISQRPTKARLCKNMDRMPPHVEALIATRAGEVRCSGAWIGLSEWIAWACMREVAVQMLIGSYIVDPVATVAPQLRVESPRAACKVAAVQAVRATTWQSATGGGHWKPQINHYVIGVRV